ncbi:hypothetical protein [Clostridium sp.]|uniref:hypothetical protein n=1 Tax=Clostridium sp. TaxID=1506 RepID=UPI001A3E9664|nr:hypothetical protein [Clostridium sp.]MBK5241935.1 hypothetical protein [Clostridium sp.]
MNTQGWIRGYIAYNSPLDKFVEFVVETISKEFTQELKVDIINERYEFTMARYRFHLTKNEIKVLQHTGPYALDKTMLETMKKQGLVFDISRSQYIRYCFGNI